MTGRCLEACFRSKASAPPRVMVACREGFQRGAHSILCLLLLRGELPQRACLTTAGSMSQELRGLPASMELVPSNCAASMPGQCLHPKIFAFDLVSRVGECFLELVNVFSWRQSCSNFEAEVPLKSVHQTPWRKPFFAHWPVQSIMP